MSHYAIGDLQGCYDEFRDLLDLIEFDAVVLGENLRVDAECVEKGLTLL